MTLSIIVAKAENNVIGKDNDLVWYLPADLKYFKQTTSGHYVIMGRKTFESFGKPLPNRTHIIITRNKEFKYPGVHVVHSLDEAIEMAKQSREEEVFVLGGAEIYRQSMDKVDRLYVTEVKAIFEGDTFFPEIDQSQWKEVSRQSFEADEKNKYPYAFVVYERK